MEAIGMSCFKTSMSQIACGLHSYCIYIIIIIIFVVFVGHLRGHPKWDIEQHSSSSHAWMFILDVGLISTPRTMNKFGLSVTVLYCGSSYL